MIESIIDYKISLLGVPYPAKFDLPTEWTDTTFKLSWRVNCSIHAPIINYQLEFKELPHGQWVVMNIPAKFDNELLLQHRRHKNRRKKSKKHLSDIYEFKQSYTIKGLTKDSSYKVLQNFEKHLNYNLISTLAHPRNKT